jgi:threonine synthase
MRQVSFSVPTGNFGDIFAGYLARKMGLPIKQLIVATNQNDILHRSFNGNDYSKGELKHSLSPSMDIMVSSNFERLLFDLYDKDGLAIAALMDKFAETGKLEIEPHRLEKAKAVFTSYAANDDVTIATIAKMYKETGEIIDPHTAIGVKAAEECNVDENIPMIMIATAHPAKFVEAILKSGQKEEPKLPEHLADLLSREEKYSVIENDITKIQEFIAKNISL